MPGNNLYPADIQLEKYILNAELDSYKNRLTQAYKRIQEALNKVPHWYVAWSGGKDSTVLAHLSNLIKPRIFIWSERDDLDFPGEIDFIQEVAIKYNFNLYITRIDNIFELLKRYKVDICENLHRGNTPFCRASFLKVVQDIESKFDGVFLGLRDQESRTRRLNTLSRGYLYKRNNGVYTCNPLYDWKAQDIFSYLITNEIPIQDLYFKTKFRPMEEIRKSWMIPGEFARKGDVVWLKYYYPELFQKLVEIDPKVKSYV